MRRFDEILASVLRSLERTRMTEGRLTQARAIRDDLELSTRRGILNRALGCWLEALAFKGIWFAALEEVKLARGLARRPGNP